MSMAFLGAMKNLTEQAIEEAFAAMRESDNLDAVEIKVADTERVSDAQPVAVNGTSEKAKNPRS
jgi:hypothetical protein